MPARVESSFTLVCDEHPSYERTVKTWEKAIQGTRIHNDAFHAPPAPTQVQGE